MSSRFGFFENAPHEGDTFDSYHLLKPGGREPDYEEQNRKIRKSCWFRLLKTFFPAATDRTFRSLLGVTPLTLDHCWNLILLFEGDVTRRTNAIKKKHPAAKSRDLLMLVAFLRTNNTYDVMHPWWAIKTPKTFRNRIKYIRTILSSRNLCRSDYILHIDPPVCERYSPFNVGDFAYFADGMECFVCKLVDFNLNTFLFSGYKKTSTFKYLIFCSFTRGYLCLWEGNWGGPKPDDQCLKECTNLRKKLSLNNWLVCGDSKFSSVPGVWTPVEWRGFDEVQKALCGRRSVIEHVVGQFGKFLVLGNHYRGSKNEHRDIFTVIGNFVYSQLLECPLRSEPESKSEGEEMEDE